MTVTDAKKQVNRGWHPLVSQLFSTISKDAIIHDLKEKFGGLRVDAENTSGQDLDAIEAIETKSQETCEGCGGKGLPVRASNDFVKTLCVQCNEKNRAGLPFAIVGKEYIEAEKEELDRKIETLTDFIFIDVYQKLSEGERHLLSKQLAIMLRYSVVLGNRIIENYH